MASKPAHTATLGKVGKRLDKIDRASAPSLPRRAAARPAGDDFWPLLVELALSQRGRWIAICADLDLTPMQGHVLRTLDPERPVAMSALADILVCDASNVTGIVDKLESRGLIARQGADNDRRIKMLAVTTKGRQLRERLSSRIMEPPASVAALPADVRRQLADVLRPVVSGPAGDATDPAG
jgi:DNA-binding MarR family transcriptional regulator